MRLLPSRTLLLVGWLRIINAVVMDPGKDLIETPGDFMKILECQLTFIKLAVNKDIVDDLLYKPLNSGRGRVDKCT